MRARRRHHARHSTSISAPKDSGASPRRSARRGSPGSSSTRTIRKSIALLRRDAPCPIASGETLLERRDFRPYFEAYAFDTAIVDVIWNGFYESLKIAALADVYEVNVAPHNFYGHLASAISAHFCAAVPNFRIMEIDIDGVPWRDEIVSTPPVIDNGDYYCRRGRAGAWRSTRPGCAPILPSDGEGLPGRLVTRRKAERGGLHASRIGQSRGPTTT